MVLFSFLTHLPPITKVIEVNASHQYPFIRVIQYRSNSESIGHEFIWPNTWHKWWKQTTTLIPQSLMIPIDQS
jgi:hypothetical protein